MRATAHYIFAIAVFTIYGGQVCPFIAGVDIVKWGITVTFFLALAYLARIPIRIKYIGRLRPDQIINNTFYVDLAIMVVASVAIAAFNYFYSNFPLGSGLKVVICGLALGFFAACDIALEQERKLYDYLKKHKKSLTPTGQFITLTNKFSLISSLTIVLLAIIVAMIIIRDIEWLSQLAPDQIKDAQIAITVELAFVAIISLMEVINLIVSYSKNLWLFFEAENSTLHAAMNGNLDDRVTISSDNEFGIMGHYTNRMIDKLKDHTTELATTRDVTILTLAALTETRSSETGAHIMRTQLYVKILAKKLQEKEEYKDLLDEKTINLIYNAAPLHDIGKVGVPDEILLKPGRLTKEEFEIIKRHPTMGRNALKWAERKLGFSSFLHYASEIAYSHHEKWDGTGYPNQLKEKQIPLSARIMAVADVYDALVHKQVYKKAFSKDEALSLILDGRGTAFDPDVVDAFIETHDEFVAIVDKHQSVGNESLIGGPNESLNLNPESA